MARKARSAQINEDEVGIYHLTSRCVRSAFLCGSHPTTGQSYEHRREWIEERLIFLARIFLVDLIGHGILGNHLHNVVRNRPDLAKKMSNQEVAARWWRLTRRADPDDPIRRRDRNRIKKILRDKQGIAEYRRRLSSLSWLMSTLKYPISVRANREDGTSGHFWASRFKAKKIENVQQLLAAMVYVDLNPIRAGIAETPEDSLYTSVYSRIQADRQRRRRGRKHRGDKLRQQIKQLNELNAAQQQVDAWLSPINEADEAHLPVPPPLDPAPPQATLRDKVEQIVRWQLPARASNQGCLPMSFQQYLQLVDWSGRQSRPGKRGRIPKTLAPILNRLGFGQGAQWLPQLAEYAKQVSDAFSRPANPPPAAGQSSSLLPVTHPKVCHEQMFF